MQYIFCLQRCACVVDLRRVDVGVSVDMGIWGRGCDFFGRRCDYVCVCYYERGISMCCVGVSQRMYVGMLLRCGRGVSMCCVDISQCGCVFVIMRASICMHRPSTVACAGLSVDTSTIPLSLPPFYPRCHTLFFLHALNAPQPDFDLPGTRRHRAVSGSHGYLYGRLHPCADFRRPPRIFAVVGSAVRGGHVY